MNKLQIKTFVLLALLTATTANAGNATEPNQKAIESVIAGKTSVAYASWWGFDPADSTVAIQSAINSGASKVIVEKMEGPWIVKKLQLASDQEIVFEKGVVVLAKKGEFKGKTDSLFSASLQKNMTLTGDGAILQMRRADYAAQPYRKAEWRNILSIRSCSNVTVSGLILKESGGDGIYLGVSKQGVTNKNILIKDVICERNYRQGISIISAENLLIENCKFYQTDGTAPMAGVDFEPNLSSERLVNCVLRNCVAEDNTGYGYLMYLPNLNRKSMPISIRFENCRASGASQGLVCATKNGSQGSVEGLIEFENCTFESTKKTPILIYDKPATACPMEFKNCNFIGPGNHASATPSISFLARAGVTENIGGVKFENCTIKTGEKNPVMSFIDSSYRVSVTDVTGTLRVEKKDTTTDYTLTEKLINKWMPPSEGANIKQYHMDGLKLVPLVADATSDSFKLRLVRRRYLSNYVMYATKGESVSVTFAFSQLVKYTGDKMPVEVTAPSGKVAKVIQVPFKESAACEFIAPETGSYHISCEPGTNFVSVISSSHKLCLASEGGPIRLMAATGDFFFWVPPGTEKWAVMVVGGGGEECVNAALFDSSDKKVWSEQSIAKPTFFVNNSGKKNQGEVWRLTLDKPTKGFFEDHFVQLLGVPSVLSLTRESLLIPAQ